MRQSKEVFKVQLPVKTNMKPPQALIYNQDRSIFEHTDILPSLVGKMGDHHKLFFYGYWDERIQKVVLEHEAAWQEW